MTWLFVYFLIALILYVLMASLVKQESAYDSKTDLRSLSPIVFSGFIFLMAICWPLVIYISIRLVFKKRNKNA